MPDEQTKWRSEVVDTDDRFFVLRDQWDTLQQSLVDPHSAPFLGWDWLYLWWTIYRESNWQLAIGLIWRDDALVAIFPFYIKNALFKELHFLGTGEAEQEEVATEYLDCLIVSDMRVHQNALQWLSEFFTRIDIVVFERMLESATILSMFSKIDMFSVRREVSCGARYILGLENYGQQFSSNLTRKYRKYQNNRGEHQWRIDRCCAVEKLERYLAELKRLHELRWRSKGKSGAFASARFVEFHRKFTEAMLVQNRLYLGMLYIQETLVGCLYAIDGKETRYFYQAGFLPVMQQFSPGHLGHFVAMDDALDKGLRQYDLMMGGLVNSYKQQYISSAEPMLGIVAVKKSWQMLVYRLNKKLSELFS